MQRSYRKLDPDLIYVLLLMGCGLVAYANSFVAAFHFDDIRTILENDALLDLGNVGRIFSYCPERFLTYLTLAINVRISEFDPTSYHIVNFFIHFLASFFLYFLFLETWKTPALRDTELKTPIRVGAFFAGAIFLLHPLQTQSVTYVIQRAESMVGMFYLATLFFYVRGRLATERKHAYGYFIFALVFALGATFSKETAVTLPASIILYERMFFNTPISLIFRKKIFLIALCPAVIILVYKLGPLIRKGFFYDPGIAFGRKEYFLTQFSVLVTYLRLFVWPDNQNIDWDYPISTHFFEPKTFASFLVLLMLLIVAFLVYRKLRLFSLSIFAFFITLAPTSSIIPIIDVIQEHRMYLAVAFLAMGCGQILLLGLEKIRKVTRRGSVVAAYIAILSLVLLLAGLTHARNEVWQSELSLWKDAVQKSPNKARPHNNYGKALYLLVGKMTKDAKREFEMANQLWPEWPIPYHNLAVAYFEEGDYQRAIALDEEAVKRMPNYKIALYQLGRSHMELGQWHQARVYLERLIRMSPGSKFLQAHVHLVEVYLEMGLREEAIGIAKNMAHMEEEVPGLDYFRGLVFYALEDFSEARSYFTRQTEKEMHRVPSYLMLGQIGYVEGRYKEAETAFRQVLEEDKWSQAAHYNLAVLFEKSDRLQEAVEHFQQARAIDPFSFGSSFHLIRLYGGLGLSEERTNLLIKLLGIKPDSKEFSFLQDNLHEDFHQTLTIYREKFLPGNPSPGSFRARAVIATLREDYPEAIRSYEKDLENLTDQQEIQRVRREVARLEGVLQGKEPLVIPI